ncbi:hypothetical protein [Streptomyces sp. NPDC048157]
MYRALSLDAYDIEGVTEAEAAAYGDDVRDAWELRETASVLAEAHALLNT